MVFKKNKNIPLVFCSVIFSLGFFLCGLHNAYAASLSFSPSSGNVTVGNILNVSVFVDTQNKAINNADAVINFPSSLLEVISVSKSQSIFTLWVEEPSFSNANGSITFNGGLPTPGFTGSSGRLATIAFRVKNPGTASVLFSGASVRANDGFGTDILQTRGQASYNLISEEQPTAQPAPVVSEGSIAITSPTHPDQAKWYKSDSAKFEWKLPEGALEVRVLLDDDPKSTPTVRYTPAISSRTVNNLDDGTHYFHMQVRTQDGWNAPAHFRVNVDTRAPKRFEVAFPHGTASVNPQPIILFNTEDDGSGIEYYDVKVGEGGPLRTTASADSNPYTLPLLDPGTYTVAVTAYDRAGNAVTEDATFTIEGIDAPKITEYPKVMTVGDIFRVRGATYPNATIEVVVSDKNGPVANESTKSNSLGDFGLVFSKRIGPGDYTFTARVTDARGARSLPTEPLAFSVGLHLFSDALAFVTNYFLIVVVGLLAIAGIAAVGIWSTFRLMHLTRVLRKESLEAEQTLHKSFAILKHDLETHIRRLKRAKRKRKLSDEELAFLEQFEHDLQEAEHAIADEVKDITEK